MKIGLSTGGFSKIRETEESFAIIEELGAETCGVYLQTFYEYRPEFAKKYCGRLSKVGVNSVCVAPYNFEPQLLLSSRRVRGDGLYWLDQIMRSAQLFGAKNYAFRGGNLGNAIDLDGAAERLREVSEFCAHYGVSFCLENSQNGLFNSPKIFRGLKERIPHLASALDFGAAEASGYPWQTYLAATGDGLSEVLIPARFIEQRFEEIFKRLKDSGFDGAFLIDADGVEDLEEVKRLVDFVKERAYRG